MFLGPQWLDLKGEKAIECEESSDPMVSRSEAGPSSHQISTDFISPELISGLLFFWSSWNDPTTMEKHRFASYIELPMHLGLKS